MAFLFVVHVPYDPKSDKPGFGEKDENAEKNVVSKDKTANDLDTAIKEDDTNKENTVNGWVDSDESINKRRDPTTTDLIANNEEPKSENAEVGADEISPKDTEFADAALIQCDATITEENVQQQTAIKKSDQKCDEATAEAAHSEENEGSHDNETIDLSKDSELNDNKEVDDTAVGRFDVKPVEESEVKGLCEPTADKNADTDSSTIEVETGKPLSDDVERSVDDATNDRTEEDEKTKTLEEKCLTPLITITPIYKEVLSMLESYEVENVSLQKVVNDKLLRMSFVKEDSKNSEEILNKLKSLGVGRKPGSSVSIFPTSVHESFTGEETEESSTPVDEKEPSAEAQEKESKFKKSIKSRLIVQQVVDSVRGNAEFTFDYLLLIMLAR